MQKELAGLVAHHLGGHLGEDVTKVGEFLRLVAGLRP
jgi:hypothetical protein